MESKECECSNNEYRLSHLIHSVYVMYQKRVLITCWRQSTGNIHYEHVSHGMPTNSMLACRDKQVLERLFHYTWLSYMSLLRRLLMYVIACHSICIRFPGYSHAAYETSIYSYRIGNKGTGPLTTHHVSFIMNLKLLVLTVHLHPPWYLRIDGLLE